MNTGRFLTRVFDKKEKKMLYPGDGFDHIDHRETLYYNGLSDKGIICAYFNTSENGLVQEILDIIPFDDRFIPMQCWWNPDKNKKLIYEDDILLTSDNEIIQCMYIQGEGLVGSYKDDYKMLWTFSEPFEVLGNKWEIPELLEKISQTEYYGDLIHD